MSNLYFYSTKVVFSLFLRVVQAKVNNFFIKTVIEFGAWGAVGRRECAYNCVCARGIFPRVLLII